MKTVKKCAIFLMDMFVLFFLLTSVLFTISVLSSGNRFSLPKLGPVYLYTSGYEDRLSGVTLGSITAIYDAPIEKIKKDDIIAFARPDNNIILRNVTELKGASVTAGDDDVSGGNMIGRKVMTIPYLGYLLDYADTTLGLIVYIIIDLLIIFVFISIPIMDMAKNSSRHRKRIVRKRRRRNARYMEEGLYGSRSAVV